MLVYLDFGTQKRLKGYKEKFIELYANTHSSWEVYPVFHPERQINLIYFDEW